jgi:hypothetical protein
VKFRSPKSEFQVALDELRALIGKRVIWPMNRVLVTLGKMRRLRFDSPAREAEATAGLREAMRMLTPAIEAGFGESLVEGFRRSEAAFTAMSKEKKP